MMVVWRSRGKTICGAYRVVHHWDFSVSLERTGRKRTSYYCVLGETIHLRSDGCSAVV